MAPGNRYTPGPEVTRLLSGPWRGDIGFFCPLLLHLTEDQILSF